MQHLGAYSSLGSLLELPELSAADSNQLRQSLSTEPYHVPLQSQSLTLTLQCMQPGALPHELTWGLQAIALNALTWQGSQSAVPLEERPAARELHQMTADDVLALFAGQMDAEDMVSMHPMLCFPYAGTQGQDVSVLAMFEQHSKTLETISFSNLGTWRPLPEAMEPPVSADEQQPSSVVNTSAAAVCRSGSTVPLSGIWEGRLPAGHPEAELLHEAPHRFVFKRRGDTLGTVGLPAFDEQLVRWAWVSE